MSAYDLFMNKNGLWRERIQEVEEKGRDNASSIARLIYACEIDDGIDQHASEDLKFVSSQLAALRTDGDKRVLQLMDEIELRTGNGDERWKSLREILEGADNA